MRCVVAVALAALFTACTGGAVDSPVLEPAGTTTSTAAPAIVAGTPPQLRFVEPAIGAIQGVSPDGSRLLVADRAEVCIQPIEGGQPSCVEWPEEGDAAGPLLHVAWSRGGERAVFFDRRLVAVSFEAPVWGLDVGRMELTEIRGGDGTSAIGIALDPDHGEIVIVGRIDGGGPGFSTIADDGEADYLAPARPALISWLPGSQSVVTTYRSGEIGVWLVDGVTGERRMIAPEHPELGLPDLVAVARDGTSVLVAFRVLVSRQFFAPNTPVMATVDVDDGQIMPIVPTQLPFVGPVSAATGDDGGLAYLWYRGETTDDEVVLSLLAADGSLLDEVTITPTESRLPEPADFTALFNTVMAPVWAGDRLVFPTAEWALVVDR